MTLRADIRNETIVVRDTEGGTWWPSDDALAEIAAAPEPEAKAVEICESNPMKGEWRQ